MGLSQLRQLWNKDKQFYRINELGTGVQSFVKKTFESEELFNLKEGKLSTSDENRKNEFIHEKPSKEKRRADFYIYINSDITIPVEVECFENIQAGERQLFNYQRDFEKQYGILTDGFTWRFYNNNIYKTFTLKEFLDDTELFLVFWKEYVKPEFYYLSFFEKVGQLAFVEETKLRVENNRELFFDNITKLIRTFKNSLKIEHYIEEDNSVIREKRAVELTYAYVIQFILYKALVDNDFDEFSKEFEQVVLKIYESLKSKRYKDILGIIEGISVKISKNVYRPFTIEQDYIREKMQDLYHSLENNLSDVSPWLDIFVFIKKYNFSNVRNEIFGYIYENYLKELYEESKKGQYFTDPAIVNFMLQQIGYKSEQIKKSYDSDKNSISIIDPSCGSGTFLYSATNAIIEAFRDGGTEVASKIIEEVITNNVFGLDIEEFPLYLAEMNILMRILPFIINEKYNNPIDKKIKVFWTKDSIAEFINAGLNNTLNDIDVAAGQQGLFITNKLDFQFDSFMREKGDLEEMKRSMRPPRKRFDYVIGNPPYISYNDASTQKVLIFEFMKHKKAKLSDIYGVNLHSVRGSEKKYAPKPNLYAFFIALGLALLKDKGRLCYIVPQTILTAGDLDVLRFHLAKFTTIEKIITFAGKMFVGRGLKQNKSVATSSLIFVVKKNTTNLTNKVEILNYTDPDDDVETILTNISRAKKIKRKIIMQNSLLQNVTNWNFIKQNKEYIDFYEQYRRNSDDIAVYYDHSNAERAFGARFYFDGGGNINSKDIILDSQNALEIFDYKTNNYERYTATGFSGKFFNLDNRITFPQGSQGLPVFKQKYKILWRTKDTPRFQFCDRDILLVGNQSLTIASSNKREIEYLLALLNSDINKLLLKNNLLQENEQSYLVPIKAIKEYVRTPKITNYNKFIKEKIIRLTEELLNLERVDLSNLVDFSNTTRQKFDRIQIDNGILVLEKGGDKEFLTINKDQDLIKKALGKYLDNSSLITDNRPITLEQLRNLPVIDKDRQNEIKGLIDDLVFCLYFGVKIPEDMVSAAEFIKSQCEKNEFYKILSKNRPLKNLDIGKT